MKVTDCIQSRELYAWRSLLLRKFLQVLRINIKCFMSRFRDISHANWWKFCKAVIVHTVYVSRAWSECSTDFDETSCSFLYLDLDVYFAYALPYLNLENNDIFNMEMKSSVDTL